MEATDIMWNEHRTRLLAYVRRRVAVVEDAEDIVQDILFKAARGSDQIRSEDRLEAWLYGIARTTLIDHYRKHRTPTESMVAEPVAEEEIEDSIQAIAGCLEPFIQDLAPDYRDALVLADLHRIPQAEVAERLGISLSGAKSRIQRARKQLAEAYTACCELIYDSSGRIMDREPRKSCGCHGACDHD